MSFERSRVTDAGLKDLKGLNQLVDLGLSDNKVTDSGLKYLEGLDQLHRLILNNTEVTNEGVKKLLQALPGCGVFHQVIKSVQRAKGKLLFVAPRHPDFMFLAVGHKRS